MDLSRLHKILEEKQLIKIKNTKVLLVGVGGVGGFALEALVRMGINNITIIDNDTIATSNLNRQLITNTTNIGYSKIEESKKRAMLINPEINIISMETFLLPENMSFLGSYDYIIDACDTITTKIALIEYALKNEINIITCLGTGNRLDPTKLEITNINKTNNDPIAKVLRKLLKEHNLPLNIPCIWSKELPIKTGDRAPGSCILVPSVAGIYAVSYIINDILKSAS